MPETDFELYRRDILRQGELLATFIPKYRGEIARLFKNAPKPEHVYLVGCGDSYNVGAAVKYTWERLLQVPVEAVPAMTFGRFAVDTAPGGSWVIVLSQSGSVNRVIEALRQAKKRNFFTIAISSKPESRLVKEGAAITFLSGFERLGFAPGTSSYTLSVGLYLELAANLCDNIKLSENLQRQIDEIPAALNRAVALSMHYLEGFANKIERSTPTLILGSGCNLATAGYGERKFCDVCQAWALAKETEEYAHDVFYNLNENSSAVLIAPPDQGLSRSREVAHWLSRRGLALLILTTKGHEQLFQNVTPYYLALPESGNDLTPLTYAVPFQVLAYYIGKRLGSTFYRSANAEHYDDGDAQIYESEIYSGETD